MELIFKTLFEIKLLHEYFAKREDGSSLLNEQDPAKRAQGLELAFSQDRESLNRDIGFDFPETFRQLYENHGLKLLPSYAGCRVLCRVTRKVQPDQSEWFVPLNPLPDSMEICISISRKNNQPDIYTNARIRQAIPSSYLFTSENISGTKQFPFLTNPVDPYHAGYAYDQGELSISTNNKLQETYFDNQGNRQQFEDSVALKTVSNEKDRLLLPLKFNYSVQHTLPVRHLEFKLKDAQSADILQFSFDRAEPIRSLPLDFSEKEQILQLTEKSRIPVFTLTVSGDNGYLKTNTVAFQKDLYAYGNWGLIHLRPKANNAAFNLVDSSGFIIRRKNASGIWNEAPVFEILMKSRLSHFRYLNNKGNALDLAAPLQNFLAEENGALISRMPVALAHYYSMVPDSSSTSTRYLPQPVDLDLKKDNRQRIYFDVYVPESEMFPIVH